MTRKETKVADDVMEGQIIADGMPEIPDWATESSDAQAIAMYRPPAESQWRRQLQPHELIEWIAAQIGSYEEDDPRMALEMAAQIVTATTADKVLSGGAETTKGRDILDTPIRCDAIKFVMSTEPKGCPYFAVLSVVNTGSGVDDIVSVGGWRLVLQLGQLHYLSAELPEGSPCLVAEGTPGAIRRETYPHFFKIKQAPTSSGRSVNYLTGVMN